MKYMEYPPSSALPPFIKCYWSLSDFSVSPVGHQNQFLTDGGMELVFDIGDTFTVVNSQSVFNRHNGSFVIGPMTKAQLGRTSGECHLFGVCFLPGGADPFLCAPARELTDRCLDAEDVWGPKVKILADRVLGEPQDLGERIDMLNRFFGWRIDRPSPEYRLLYRSLQIIRQSKGQTPIELLARKMGINRRRLERLFIKMVGISPLPGMRKLLGSMSSRGAQSDRRSYSSVPRSLHRMRDMRHPLPRECH
jgi:hypothetical protein